MERPRVIAVGELLLDVAIGGARHDATIRVKGGGSAANIAVWAADCGAESGVVSRVGDDLAGSALRGALEARGVEVLAPTTPGGHTGTFAVVDGKIRVDRGASAGLVAADLPDPLRGEVVVLSAYVEPATAAAALARAAAPWVAALGRPLEGATAVCLNEDEARRLTGNDPEEAARVLSARFRLVCVTCGAAGAYAVLDGHTVLASSPGAIPGDATGAGDAFAAGLLVALARGAGLAKALAEGARCGAASVASADGWPPLSSPP